MLRVRDVKKWVSQVRRLAQKKPHNRDREEPRGATVADSIAEAARICREEDYAFEPPRGVSIACSESLTEQRRVVLADLDAGEAGEERRVRHPDRAKSGSQFRSPQTSHLSFYVDPRFNR